MSYAIVFSSKTGNTALLAQTLQEQLPQADCCYFGAPDAAALAADTLYVGFWTDKGKAHVAAREYRYVSPVYYYERGTGEILAIESVALTNVPNLTGLKALASRESGLNLPTGDITMSFLKTMASVLGVTDAEPTEAAVEAAARRVISDASAMKSAMSVMAEAAKSDDKTPCGIAKAVQAVAARAEHPDVSRYVPVETFNAVNAELGQMKAAQSLTLVEQGKAEGKISPALEGWAKEAALNG